MAVWMDKMESYLVRADIMDTFMEGYLALRRYIQEDI